MRVHIVIDNSKDVIKPYSERYKVFKGFEKAKDHAEKCGYSFGFLTPTPEVGIKNSYQCGDKDISIINVEIEDDES